MRMYKFRGFAGGHPQRWYRFKAKNKTTLLKRMKRNHPRFSKRLTTKSFKEIKRR